VRYWGLVMSKLEKYPKYKDSGVEWLGEIPEHWKVTRLANIGIVVDSVSQVTSIAASEIEEPPSHVKTDKTNYMLAIAKLKNGLGILVNIDKLVSNNKFALKETHT